MKRAVADAVVERAASQLGEHLRELAAALDSFPSFMGGGSIQAVEVEPSGVSTVDRGCVVVCPDGGLYKLVLHVAPGPLDLEGVDPVEEMSALDVSPADYIAYAHAAVKELARILEEWERGGGL